VAVAFGIVSFVVARRVHSFMSAQCWLPHGYLRCWSQLYLETWELVFLAARIEFAYPLRIVMGVGIANALNAWSRGNPLAWTVAGRHPHARPCYCRPLFASRWPRSCSMCLKWACLLRATAGAVLRTKGDHPSVV